MSQGRRIEPASLCSQGPAARTIVLRCRAVSADKNPKIHRTIPTGNGLAATQAEYLTQIIPKIRGTKGRQNLDVSELVIVVVT